MNIKKTLALVICVIMSMGVLCACEDEENIAMKDLPYGSTMRQLIDTPITICFDGRFFTDDEMRVVSDYFYAVQTKDAELFKKTQNPDYVSYLEKNSNQNLDDFLQNIAEDNAEALGENFEYSYIEAVNCGGKNDDMEIRDIIELMNSIYEENGKDESFEDTLIDEKFAALDMTAQANEDVFTYNDKIIYIFTCKDGIYIFS